MQTIKSVSGSRRQITVTRKPVSELTVRIPTLLILSILGFASAISLSWLLGNSHVTDLFVQLHLIQENPPSWLMPPQLDNKYFLLLPTLTLFFLAQIVIKLSPQPQPWSRSLVAAVLFALLIRYFLWRSLSTLNLANPVDGIFSILLLSMEFLAMGGTGLQLLLLFTAKSREQEADKYSVSVQEKRYNPTVDILIPTYNEPDFILKRTIIGCQAIDYANKKIYVLDDTKRQSVKQLCQELGCNYITRPDNSHAKAGNLNHALRKTNSELILIFDADFVPTTNFLERTVGFFQKHKVALVQTPQSFYNSDPIAQNLGLEKIVTSEEEVFYRHLQPIKDGAGSVVCAGTSFIARRSALREIGYFDTESLSEDYYTGIRLSARGYELVYLDEKLSAGLAAESVAAHIDQRLRWVRGTLQAFFVKANPLTIPGLNLWQRLGHLDGLWHWFTCLPRVFFLILPVFCIFAQVTPVLASTSEMVYIFLPYYAMQMTMFAWINKRSRSILLSDVYSLVQAIPVSITVIKVMLSPFSKGFKVTPKGVARDQFNYNWTLALPMSILFGATLISLAVSLLNPLESGFNLGLYWSSYNLLTLSIALMTLLDLPKPSFYEWFSISQQVNVFSDRQVLQGITSKISEEGLEIILDQSVNLATEVKLEILPQELFLSGKITRSYSQNGSLKAIIKFHNVSLEQHRELVKMLYCRPGQWKRRKTPNELQSALILFRLLLRPLMFLNAKKVSQLRLQY